MKIWKNRFLAFGLALVLILGISFVCQQKKWVSGLQSAYAETGEKDFKVLKTGSGGQTVKEMQTVLRELGYYDGKVDGNFSRAFEASVKAFQKEFGLKETGKIDYELYSLLLEEFSGIPEETEAPAEAEKPLEPQDDFVQENGEYSDKEHVAAYLKKFGKLPSNYITKKQAQDLGWVSTKGNLWNVAPGKSIGGDRFGNYEGALPTKNGRQYYECDIDFSGGSRNAKRILYSNDGLVFYTEDHYTTFEEIK